MSEWYRPGKVKLIGKPDLNIDAIYAIIAQGPEGEGIMGASVMVEGHPMMMPLIGADKDRMKNLVKVAKQISEKSKTPFRIFRFDNKTDVTKEFEE